MIAMTAESADILFKRAASYLLHEGAETTRRGQAMLESRGPVALTLTAANPMVVNSNRKINPWATLAEFPWIMAGRSDIRWLSPFMPRAADFSDDGLRWRAGYGPRMYDQISYVVDTLQRDPLSRRAVISLWQPEDRAPGYRDYPCTNWLSFQYRPEDDRLDMLVAMRSNDLFWGYSGANSVNFSLLHQSIAQWTGLRAGHYTHVADNLHIYRQRHGERARLIDEGRAWASWDLPAERLNFGPSLEAFRQEADHALNQIMCGGDLSSLTCSWLRDWAEFMSIWPLVGQADARQQALGAIMEIWDKGHVDWAIAARNWMGETSGQN